MHWDHKRPVLGVQISHEDVPERARYIVAGEKCAGVLLGLLVFHNASHPDRHSIVALAASEDACILRVAEHQERGLLVERHQ